MEIEGHPTQDLVEELEVRGAVRVAGTTDGPAADALKFLAERYEASPGSPGYWLFLPAKTFMTGLDEIPG